MNVTVLAVTMTAIELQVAFQSVQIGIIGNTMQFCMAMNVFGVLITVLTVPIPRNALLVILTIGVRIVSIIALAVAVTVANPEDAIRNALLVIIRKQSIQDLFVNSVRTVVTIVRLTILVMFVNPDIM